MTSASTRAAAIAAGVAIAFVIAPAARAQTVQCPVQPCSVVPSPYFVNVYWGMPRTVPVAGAGNPTDPGALSKTSDRIEAFTRALVSSDYFLKAAQYQIPGPFEMGPSVYVDATTCPGVPIPTTIGSEHGDGHEAHGLADALIECLKLQHPEWDTDRLVLNLILPGSVAGIKADGWCPGALADHGHFGGSPATFMPTSCSGSFTTFSTRLTHEMIEAITRAHPIGGYYDIWPSSTYFQNEVGDNCNGGSPMVPGAPYTQNFLPTLGGIAGLYWSNSDNGCVSGLPTQGPNTPGITMRGSGKNMTIDLTGDFGGTLPDDLAANTYSPGGGMNTAFIEAEISGPTHDWTAGNFLRFPVRDRVGFRTITWTRTNGTDSIHLGGFDGNYVAGGAHSVRPGDTITVTITSPKSGLTTTKSDTTNPGSGYGTLYIAPVTGSPHKWVFFNDGARLEGSVVDFYGEPVEGKVVHIANGFGLDDQETSATNGGFSWVLDYPFAGAFSAKLSPVPATVAVNIHPVADNLDNDTGTVSGGNTVVISGGGFRKQHTVVRFACGKAHVDVTPKSISLNALSLTTPASPCGKGAAAATVTVLVDGLQSLPLTWHYIIPDQPVLTFLPGCFPSQPIFSALQVNAYQADGSLSSEQITLTAPYAAFNNHTSQQITIASNTQVSMVGSGPITATPVNKPQLAVTGQWPAPVPDASCIPRLPQPVTVHVFDPGIVESVGVQPELVETRQGTLATWMLPAAENANAGSLVQLATPTVRAAARTDQLLSVRALGADELLRLYTDHSTLLSRGRGDARLGGAAFSIDFAAEELRGGTLLGDFVRPVDVTAEVAWLADSPGSAWVVIPASTDGDDESGRLLFTIRQPGTYALATRPLPHRRRTTDDR